MVHRCCSRNINGPSSWPGSGPTAAGSGANVTCRGTRSHASRIRGPARGRAEFAQLASLTAFEADEERRTRAQKLDEGLAIYAGLMGGQPFSYSGRHYSAQHPAAPAQPGRAGRRP
jgi:hypothetical protein